MVIALIGYVLTMKDRDNFGIRRRIQNPWWLEKRYLKLGAPLALSYGFETTAFMCLTMMAGWLGASYVAAFQVIGNFIALIFMIAIGMSAATAIRVGNAIGRRDMPGMRMAGWVGAGLIAVIMTAIGALVLAFPGAVAGVYTGDGAVLAIAVPAMSLAAILLLADGLQGVLIGALRGAADIWPTTLIGMTAFWLVMVPTGYLLGIALELEVRGLLFAELAGVVVATTLLTWRFLVISRRDIVPV
jgi:MATE family multidrug resistance protein